MDTVTIVFTRGELWLLHSLIRHEIPQRKDWEAPPCSRELNEQIRLALLACEEGNLQEYPLTLTRADLDAIDYCVREDMVTPRANGKDILLKTFRALFQLQMGLPASDIREKAYKEVIKYARPSSGSRDDAG